MTRDFKRDHNGRFARIATDKVLEGVIGGAVAAGVGAIALRSGGRVRGKAISDAAKKVYPHNNLVHLIIPDEQLQAATKKFPDLLKGGKLDFDRVKSLTDGSVYFKAVGEGTELKFNPAGAGEADSGYSLITLTARGDIDPTDASVRRTLDRRLKDTLGMGGEIELKESKKLKDLYGAGNLHRFGYACGSTFIPDQAKCYTDPKTGARLKVPLTKQQVERVRSRSRGADRLYTQQEEAIRNRLRSGTIPPQWRAAAAASGATKVLPSGIAEVDPKNLELDPKRFQYKLVAGASGESGSLTGVKKWDANLAGVQLAWHDPADDKVYVINGHNRTNLAKKLEVPSVTTRFIEAGSAKEARAVGALTNIAEGNGTSLDAGKFFRDSNLTQEDLTKKGIPLKSTVATEGIALSKLNDGLFNKVVQGDLSKERGVIIGKNLTDHKEQSELVDLINKQEKKGKKITNEGISELIDNIKSAPKQEQAGGLLGLLGMDADTRSLAFEKAEIQAHIKRQLATEKKLFGTVGRSRNAQTLAKGGNKIDAEKSQEISQDADRALRIFDQEKRYTGKVSNYVNAAAERIANGEKSNKVKEEVYQQVLAEIKGSK